MILIAVVASLGILCGASAELPLVAAAPARSTQYFVQNHNALIAPYAAPYIAPYANPYVAPYVTPYVAPYVAPIIAQTVIAPSPVQPPAASAAPPRPISPNPDAESVEVESARVKSLRNVGRPVQAAKGDFVAEKQRRTAAPGLISAQRLVQARLFV